MNRQETAYLKAFWNELEQEGACLRNCAMPVLSEEDFFLYQKTGNRLIYETVYFERRKYLTVFGILAEFGKRQEDIDKLSSVIDSVCEERFWALPAHVDFDCLDENTVDLFAAETAQTLAEILALMADKLPLKTVTAAKKAIMDRVLVPFCCSKTPYSWWETDRCNWSAVCAGSIGMAAIYMDRMKVFPPAWKEPCLRRVCNALQCYLSGMEDDGACTEGLGYFSYGMSYYTGFAELLSQETGEDINLMRKPKCEKIAAFQEKCYFGQGVSLSFSDGSSKEHFLPGLTAYLAHCFLSVKTPDYTAARFLRDDNCYRWLPNERNIRWLIQYGGQEEKTVDLKACDLLPSAQWMVCKDSQGNGFAAKGGHNDENHNHNDIGHFLCVYNGELLLTDLGAGEYTKEYFHDGRYQILCNRSLGHSVPMINGYEQCQGKEYRADLFEWNEEKKELDISFAGAYPRGCIDRINRKIHMKDTRDLQLSVTDCFVLSEQTKQIVENLVTPFLPKILYSENDKTEQIVAITGEKSVCHLTIKNCSNIQIVQKEHLLHDGRKTTVYLIQWSVAFDICKHVECEMQFVFAERNEEGA